MSNPVQVEVTILGQGFKLSCKEGEDRALREAAYYLDQKMGLIRDGGKVKGTDRIAIMAALGIASELLAMKSSDGPLSGMSLVDIRQKIDAMQAVLDAALTPQEKLF